jgi:hypothetical protein
LSLSVTPSGKVPPLTANVGIGVPDVVTVNEFEDPTVKTAEAGLVIARPPVTVRVKVCVALGRTPLAAVMVKPY